MATRNHSNKPTKRRALDGVDPPSSSCSSPARQPFIWCNLPPHPSPLAFHSPSEFESHYHAQHAHTCTLSQRCSKTFPTSRFLDLHIEECHSPLSIQRMERGESIFSCFLEPDQCGESFLTPKERRKHLIESHGYPPNYFFSLPFKGTGELFKRYGPTASLLRGDWKRVEGRRRRRGGRGIDDDETGQEDGKDEEMRIDPLRPEKHPPPNSLPSSSNHEPSDRRTLDENDEKFKAGTENDGLASIMDSMSSLSLVPDKIRIHRQRPKV
ncbi:hypothetical protein IE53DRAFT_342487 [Violaceomyces palustris]|uniref:Uncharacterized protein n=1 Tax=Violaceomyces palustris TaxID=1673888 RepID=A0ACD0NZX5_9BASI|nr:hypothetical protein IE53DRAFT_342487 [Violaceomyces palustris]